MSKDLGFYSVCPGLPEPLLSTWRDGYWVCKD